MVRHGRLGNAPGEDVTLTPPEIWERLERVAGAGHLFDPCPHPMTVDNLQAPWPHRPGQVDYVNPPFSELYPWATRCGFYAEAEMHTVITLVPCRTSQPYWRVLNEHACTVAYWTGDKDHGGKLARRIRFLTKDGKRMAGAPFDAALFLMTVDPEHRARFNAAFQGVATITHLRRA